ARAQAPPAASPAPSPAPSATPSAPSDPCGSILSIVNRPTFTTGVCTVRTGKVDLENGYTNYVTTGPGGGNTAVYPQSLIRIGTWDPHLDFEVGPIQENQSSLGGVKTSGMSDLGFGAKYELGYSSNADWGLYGNVTVPTGAKAFSAGNAQFTGDLDGGYTIDSVFSLAGTLGFSALSGYNSGGVAQSYFEFQPSLELTAALPGPPNQISAEYAYFSSAGPNLGAKSYVDFVYQRDFGPHVQLDVEYGFSPTVILGQKQQYLGAGLSFMN
ncbi:MAG TPA: transporter, partial [Candidatus Acidoferrales bacterium]|nr:transporter [Candidatus Acidoferrales bacterium]